MNFTRRSRRMMQATAALGGFAILTTACAGANSGESSSDEVTLTLATVNNPQMKDMEELKGAFEDEHPGVKVKFIQMEENDLRDAVTKDVATEGGQYDIVTIGAYEVPQWSANGWLADLTATTADDADYDVDDIFPPILDSLKYEDKLYALPFYGESSFIMYNKDIFEAAGVTMPERPTWQEVADLARQLDSPDHDGICLRGKPGWGEMFAPLTTTVQTFGGAWFDENWDAQVNSPEFVEATQFYVDLVKDAGESDPVSAGFTECLNNFTQGKSAIWYDATSAAGTVEDPEASSVAGRVGYAHAPIEKTEESGWLWSWNLAIPKTSQKQEAAETFIKWATSKGYQQLVGEELGWTRVPPGARSSTYEMPEYIEAAESFAPITQDIMGAVNPQQPGVAPQPYVSAWFVPIPEFQDLANGISQDLADVFAGRSDVQSVLDKGQEQAQKIGEAQK